MKPDSLLEEGATVLGYRIVRMLGAGGMGAVFEAEETTIGRRVALKVLLADLAGDPRNAARFEREAKSMSLVRHPSVIDVFAYGKLEDGRPYFVMPLLTGRSLREELARRTRFAPQDAWRLLRDVASGLAAAHRAGVLHRDLKPENVFVASYDDGAERAILLDFGIAKWTEDPSDPSAEPAPNLTATGAPIGTPVYMAPEQWWSQPCSPATDQYAFGVLMHEVLVGRPPFSSTKFPELLQAHLHQTPPSVRSRDVEVPPAVDEAIARLLAKEAKDRFDDMPAAIAALDEAFGVPTHTTGASAVAPSCGSALAPKSDELSTAKTMLADDVAPSKARRWHAPARFMVGLGLALALLVGVGYAGEARHDVREWLLMSGFGGPLSVLLAFVAAAFGAVLVGREPRSTTRQLLFGLAVLPALSAGLATWGGWSIVVAHIETASADGAFELLHFGRYEVGASDFVGLGLSSALFVGLLAGQTGRTSAAASPTRADEDRRARWALRGIGAAMVLAAGVLGFGGATSATYLLVTTGAAVALLGQTLGSDTRDTAVAASLGAVLSARGVAVGRADALAANAWSPENTRAERALAITAAEVDRAATSLAAIVVLVAFLVLALWLLLRAPAITPRRRLGWLGLELGLLLAALGPELLTEREFRQRRAAMAQGLAEQFTLFSELSPPLAGGRDLPSPAIAPAIQVTRDRIAVNGREVSRLTALDSASGRQTIAAAMIQLLARPTAFSKEGRQVDLSCTFDERLPWARVVEILTIAYEGGARDVDLLLARGETLALPPGAPPEAASMLPRDFAALPVTLDEEGRRPKADAPFVGVSDELCDAWDGATTVKVAVNPKR